MQQTSAKVCAITMQNAAEFSDYTAMAENGNRSIDEEGNIARAIRKNTGQSFRASSGSTSPISRHAKASRLTSGEHCATPSIAAPRPVGTGAFRPPTGGSHAIPQATSPFLPTIRDKVLSSLPNTAGSGTVLNSNGTNFPGDTGTVP